MSLLLVVWPGAPSSFLLPGYGCGCGVFRKVRKRVCILNPTSVEMAPNDHLGPVWAPLNDSLYPHFVHLFC